MAKRTKKTYDRRELYKLVWLGDPVMQNRIEVILSTGTDPFEGFSGSAILETALKRLVDGATPKYAGLEELNTGVRAAVEQLFRMRDAGRFGGKYAVASHPAHRS